MNDNVLYSRKVTIFHADTKNKIPYSPFGDKTFVFETLEVNSNLDFFNVLASRFILNIPLNLPEPVRTYRRKNNLDEFYFDSVDYLILDIDDVYTKKAKDSIIEFFKEYNVILGASRSYNGIDNFRMKGVLLTEPMSFLECKRVLKNLQLKLKDFCTFDEHVGRKTTLNAPMLRNDVFFNNETGRLFSVEETPEVSKIDVVKSSYSKGNNSKLTNSTPDKLNVQNLKGVKANTIDQLCLKAFQSMGFVAVKSNENGSIMFKHPSETKSIGGYFWFKESPYTMHHFNSLKTVEIYNSIRKLPKAKELMKTNLNYTDEFENFNTSTRLIQVNQKYLTCTPEVKTACAEFISAEGGLFSIRSPMGTGKSTIIHHLIKEANNQDMSVLIITNRISVANDFSEKYNVKVYNKDQYNIGDSLICQFDSLWKYNIRLFDVVIMDEFISLMMHARSNLNNSNLNISKFFGAFNKKLIIADAFLTGYENFLLSNKTENVYMLDNLYRDCVELNLYEDFNNFVKDLVRTCTTEKCTVSCTSLSFLNSLQLMLQNKGIKVVTLTALTPKSTKKLLYESFKQPTTKYDVLIYSPTLTVGVSNLNHIKTHWHFDSSMSTDAVSSIQMIKRTRKAKQINLFIKERTNFIKTTYNTIKDEYMNNIGKNIDQNFLYQIDDYGETVLSENGKKAIKIDVFKNVLEFNHKDATIWLMKYHFAKKPTVIKHKFESNALNKYTKMIKNDTKIVQNAAITEYLKLNNMERTQTIDDASADTTLKIIAEMDDKIKLTCPDEIRQKILEITINDFMFLDKCQIYKHVKQYTNNEINTEDVKQLIQDAVVNNKDVLATYNNLLKFGQNKILTWYQQKYINKNKILKNILDKCGYKIQTKNNFKTIGYRAYVVDENVNMYFEYIK